MNYLVSFRNTLKISRYLFRALVLLFWLLVVILSVFYIINVLHDRESEIRHEFNTNFDQAQRYIQRTSDVIKELKYVTENKFDATSTTKPSVGVDDELPEIPTFISLQRQSNCSITSTNWNSSLLSISAYLRYWRENFSTTYDLNRIFLVGGDEHCIADFTLRDSPFEREKTFKILQDKILTYYRTPKNERENNLYWVEQGSRPGTGYFYTVTPVYQDNRLQGLLGIEQSARMENFFVPGSLPVGVSIFDDSGKLLISLNGPESRIELESKWLQSRTWFGYSAGFNSLILKKDLYPTSLIVVYSVPVNLVLEHIRLLIINAAVFILLVGIGLLLLTRMYERRVFAPAENDAQRLEENEQFNHKIVASAPVGICILRTQDGTNILSNELAHNYLGMLTHEDRQKLTQIISGQQVNFVDVLASNQTNLQMSFVHSRYRNENVAICVLVDVSARVKMEESLQEMAHSSEQASQSKSMFLATVSHELRTPLYGIIGNLDLLRSEILPKGADRLVTAMSNSSSLLLKIISDILDFSKIESEQLKIEPREFSPREAIGHITANYLPLVVRKQLGLYCFIEPDVPAMLLGDPMRLQQVLSNLLSNAIKFTDFGCIVIHVSVHDEYLNFRVRDTGIGIPAKEVMSLFDPFFQVGSGVQHNFQGTGLGLAICEKLINMMDGDISVESEPGMGSQFTVRIPLYHAQFDKATTSEKLSEYCCWLNVHNESLSSFLESLLTKRGVNVRCWSGESPAHNDVLITDENIIGSWGGKASIQFNRTHIGLPIEPAAGQWVYSTVSPHEILTLLERIYSLPITRPDTNPELPALPASDEQNEDMMILVVDDHPINRRLLADQLNLLGYRCKTANDGVDALSVLKKHHIDIVLSDVNMPNMDGYTLTKNIRQLGLTLPVVGVTANALADEKQRCISSGMDSCLSKPVTLEVVKQTLAIYAARVRKERQSD
ncbi:two-component system sensor histidine kinase RcsC [Klebsiella sp. BIGb0407]|uniref:two-component system sensor histidine kinase RcsC n=1 Tax=Klebsiella sp. BIGb0407 TaxID=2940603 RepID=UPI0021690CFC|nr:two-component system sensor histidine kinase RcsC [Klebsiella sp. BIGb0407]MCS3431636.1 two-component system capsular synthesis sensor histidine kinase RcsC [Klebsiella sp. BIGb0407]